MPEAPPPNSGRPEVNASPTDTLDCGGADIESSRVSLHGPRVAVAAIAWAHSAGANRFVLVGAVAVLRRAAFSLRGRLPILDLRAGANVSFA